MWRSRANSLPLVSAGVWRQARDGIEPRTARMECTSMRDCLPVARCTPPRITWHGSPSVQAMASQAYRIAASLTVIQACGLPDTSSCRTSIFRELLQEQAYNYWIDPQPGGSHSVADAPSRLGRVMRVSSIRDLF